MIVTPRLRLQPLPAEDHLRLARGMRPRTVAPHPEFPGGPDPVPAWLHERHALRAVADPAAAEWLLRAIVLHDGPTVGHIGFHDVPGTAAAALDDETFEGDRPEPAGQVAEFGYTVFTDHRRHGYATEAARALVGWALGHGGLAGVLATTAPGNGASRRVLASSGLTVIGRCRMDDGSWELVWWCPAG